MTDEYEVADENQVKILVDKINAPFTFLYYIRYIRFPDNAVLS